MYLIYVIFIIAVIIEKLGTEISLKDDKPKFRIIAPQYICNVSSSKKLESQKDDAITNIRIQPLSREKICYSWQVLPRILTSQKSQWLNMNAWRSARLVEKSIMEQKDNIVDTNIVRINNTQLVPGVSYDFRVSSYFESCSTKERSYEQNFTIIPAQESTSNSKTGAKLTKPDVSLTLAGAEFIYSDQEFIFEAQVSFCQDIKDYKFRWQLTSQHGNHTPNGLQGKLLKLAAYYLEPEILYKVYCGVTGLGNNEILADDELSVEVRGRKLQVKLNFLEIVASVNQEITIIATLFYAKKENVEFTWTCQESNEKTNCQDFQSKNSNTLTATFATQGRYKVIARAKQENLFAEETCEIIVVDGVVPQITMSSIKNQHFEIPAGSPVHIEANTAGLKAGCELKWKTVKAENLAYFDESLVAGGIGQISVDTLDDSFALELSEFGNETVDLDIPLAIPEKSKTWPGIIGDSQYRLRLDVKCQCVDICDNMSSDDTVSHAEILLKTNSPPVVTDVMIHPASGVAFSTKFTISIAQAKDKTDDYPLQYTFYLRIKYKTFLIGSFIENTLVETTLPYSDSPINVFCKVCDSLGACAVTSPKSLIVSLPDQFVEEDLNNLILKMESMIKRQDYDDAILHIYGSLEIFKAMDNPNYYVKLVNSVLESLRFQIKIYKEDQSYEEIIIKLFINKAKFIMELMNKRPEDIVQGLLELYNNYILAKKRKKRSAIVSNKNIKAFVTEEDIDTGLDLIEEVIYKSKNATAIAIEKKKLPRTIERFMTRLCSQDVKYNFDKKIASFSVETINLNKKYNTFVSIPFYNDTAKFLHKKATAFIKFGKEFSNLNEVCIGKVAYANNYFMENNKNKPQTKGFIYGVKIMNTNQKLIDLNGMSIKITIKIPSESINVPQNSKLACCMINMNVCSEENCAIEENIRERGFVRCNCRSIGYYSTILKEKTATTTKPVPSTTVTVKTDITTASQIITTSSKIITTTTTPMSTSTIKTTTITKLADDLEPTTQNVTEIDIGDSVKKASWGNTSTIVIVSLLSICSVVVIFFIYQKRKHQQTAHQVNYEEDVKNVDVEDNLHIIDPNRGSLATLTYRAVHDEHLLSGSINIINQYQEGLMRYDSHK